MSLFIITFISIIMDSILLFLLSFLLLFEVVLQ